MDDNTALSLVDVAKTFTLHLQGGQQLTVLDDVSFDVPSGACVVLDGDSGSGKSTIMKMVYGNYSVDRGEILLAHSGGLLDVATAEPREILAARRDTMGYVSQFLRAVPRVAALDVVAEPLVERGIARGRARDQAAELLERLNIPQRLWHLPPATFSGGEQQRVNVARGFITHRPVLLLDEPTASLDGRNRDLVIELIRERLDRGSAMVGIFHDTTVRDELAGRVIDVTAFAPHGSKGEAVA